MKMRRVLFTCPGRLGDNILRFPIIYQWWKQQPEDSRVRAHVVLDDVWSRNIVDLVAFQPWCEYAWCEDGITSDIYGGQPWDFGKSEKWESEYDEVWHLGYRSHPSMHDDLTLFALGNSGLRIHTETLFKEPCFDYKQVPTRDLAIHVEASTRDFRLEQARNTILENMDFLHREFETVKIISQDRTLPVYEPFLQYPNVSFFEDNCSFTAIASLLSHSTLIGTNSAMWALARVMLIPQICIINRQLCAIKPISRYSEEHIVNFDSQVEFMAALRRLLTSGKLKNVKDYKSA